MKYIPLILLLIAGCSDTESIVNNGYHNLCDRQPSSMSCIKHDDAGFTPSFQTVSDRGYEMFRNFTYITDIEQYNTEEYWFDGELTSNSLSGDCDDISLTFASQLIIDGVKPSNIRFVASGVDGKLKHYYVKVMMDNGEYFDFYRIDEYTDIMYMQYDNTGVFIK